MNCNGYGAREKKNIVYARVCLCVRAWVCACVRACIYVCIYSRMHAVKACTKVYIIRMHERVYACRYMYLCMCDNTVSGISFRHYFFLQRLLKVPPSFDCFSNVNSFFFAKNRTYLVFTAT